MASDAFSKFYDSFHNEGYSKTVQNRFPEETKPSTLSQIKNTVSEALPLADKASHYIGDSITNGLNSFQQNHPDASQNVSNALNWVDNKLKWMNNTAPAQSLQAFNQGLASMSGVNLPNKMLNPEIEQQNQQQADQHPIAKFLGEGIGAIAPFSAAGKVVGKLPMLGEEAPTILGRIGQSALKTGLEGGLVGGIQGSANGLIDYAQGKGTLGDVGKNALYNAASLGLGGAILGGAGKALGEGIGAGVKGFNNVFENNFNDTFAGYKPSIEGFTPQELYPKINDLQLALPAAKPDVIQGLPTLPKVRDINGKFTLKSNNPDNLILGENKKPITLYHGTNREFTEFKPSESGELGSGIYLASNPEYANGMANGNGANIIPTHVKMKNPYIIQGEGEFGLDGFAKTIEKDFPEFNGNWNPQKWSEYLKSEGYDGVIFKNRGNLGDEYMAFDNNQVLPKYINSDKGQLLKPQLPKGLNPNSKLLPKINQYNEAVKNVQYRVDPKYKIENPNFNLGELPQRTESNLSRSNGRGNINSSIAKDMPLKSPLNSSNDISNLQGSMGADKKIQLKQMLNEKSPSQSSYQYIDTSPINFDEGLASDKGTAQDIRNSYTGVLGNQTLIGAHLAEDIGKLAPKEQEALTFYNEANGDKNLMQSWLDNQDPNLEKYKPYIQQAMNLSPEAQQAAKMMKQYYTEQGQFSKDMGTIQNIRENYNNRIYKPDVEGSPMDKSNKTQQIRTEIRNSGLNTYTKHSKERVYNTIVDAIVNGKEPATLKANDLLSIHNEELARANTNRKLADAMQKTGFGGYVKDDKLPKGMIEIPSLSKLYTGEKYVVPQGIAEGLKAITETAPQMGRLQKAQGVVKTVDLSFSLFHHLTEVAQALYNGNGKALTKVFNLDNLLSTTDFRNMEKDFVSHTGVTSKLEANQDILRSLRGQEGTLGKLNNLPGIKKITEISDKNTEYLFGKLQRWLKVTDYQNQVAKFIGKNPNITNESLVSAKQSIARQVNNAYGGLNWKALGYNPSELQNLRLGFLAPDWLISNLNLAKSALSEGGLGGNAARTHFVKAVVGSYLVGEGLNKILTGHWMHENDAGHKFEIEVAPNVYVAPLRGFGGEVEKLGSSVVTNGLIGGVAKYSQNKLAPLARTTMGIMTNKDVTGGPIWNPKDNFIKKSLAGTKYIAKSALPIPIGVSSTTQYLNSGESTPLGTAAIVSGLGRYQKSKKK